MILSCVRILSLASSQWWWGWVWQMVPSILATMATLGTPILAWPPPLPPQAPYWLPISRLDLHHKGFQRASASIGIRCQTLNWAVMHTQAMHLWEKLGGVSVHGAQPKLIPDQFQRRHGPPSLSRLQAWIALHVHTNRQHTRRPREQHLMMMLSHASLPRNKICLRLA